FQRALNDIEDRVKNKINESYQIGKTGLSASHYLWNDDKLIFVWQKVNGGRRKLESQSTPDDIKLIDSFRDYKCHRLRSGKFFNNSRINSSSHLTIYDLFTRRALRNIELILDEIDNYDSHVQDALRFCLTAASGQMSSMVFAISNRGKKQGKKSDRIEVGSWVIGYWRPGLHFEINVWNCFESRAKKFFKALIATNGNVELKKFSEINSVLFGEGRLAIDKKDAITFLSGIPDGAVHSVITDPPHSDRIPYLELSELWNIIIGQEVDFEKEIVVSNAKERGKNKDQYFASMTHFVSEVGRVLFPGGVFALMFNARDDESWKFYDIIEKSSGLEYQGYFEVAYSANSVVQDNREGSLQDYVLIFQKPVARISEFNRLEILKKLPGWKSECPRK
ncbi:MAG: DNA methylase, partial [Candidatus Omnitrophota bacterium]|nr:DNA methylase [Candidatus Omnitrophota bacterium]